MERGFVLNFQNTSRVKTPLHRRAAIVFLAIRAGCHAEALLHILIFKTHKASEHQTSPAQPPFPPKFSDPFPLWPIA
jgi:hypothetical protein